MVCTARGAKFACLWASFMHVFLVGTINAIYLGPLITRVKENSSCLVKGPWYPRQFSCCNLGPSLYAPKNRDFKLTLTKAWPSSISEVHLDFGSWMKHCDKKSFPSSLRDSGVVGEAPPPTRKIIAYQLSYSSHGVWNYNKNVEYSKAPRIRTYSYGISPIRFLLAIRNLAKCCIKEVK